MKRKKVKKLPLGLYEMFWKDGGSSLASVGQDGNGKKWFAPTNWISGIPCFDWGCVKSVVEIPVEWDEDLQPEFRWDEDLQLMALSLPAAGEETTETFAVRKEPEEGGTMFVAFVKQLHDGCDRSIACGETLWRLKAKTRNEALVELQQEIIGEWNEEYGEYENGYWGEDLLGDVILFEIIQEEKIRFLSFYVAAEIRGNKGKARIEDEMERVKYRELKRKYG